MSFRGAANRPLLSSHRSRASTVALAAQDGAAPLRRRTERVELSHLSAKDFQIFQMYKLNYSRLILREGSCWTMPQSRTHKQSEGAGAPRKHLGPRRGLATAARSAAATGRGNTRRSAGSRWRSWTACTSLSWPRASPPYSGNTLGHWAGSCPGTATAAAESVAWGGGKGGRSLACTLQPLDGYSLCRAKYHRGCGA